MREGVCLKERGGRAAWGAVWGWGWGWGGSECCPNGGPGGVSVGEGV